MISTTTFVVVGEDGGHTALTGDPKASAGGAAARMKHQGRRGYIAKLEGDARTGTLTMLEPVNDPEVDFEEVKQRFAARNKSKGSSNTVFRNINGR